AVVGRGAGDVGEDDADRIAGADEVGERRRVDGRAQRIADGLRFVGQAGHITRADHIGGIGQGDCQPVPPVSKVYLHGGLSLVRLCFLQYTTKAVRRCTITPPPHSPPCAIARRAEPSPDLALLGPAPPCKGRGWGFPGVGQHTPVPAIARRAKPPPDLALLGPAPKRCGWGSPPPLSKTPGR